MEHLNFGNIHCVSKSSHFKTLCNSSVTLSNVNRFSVKFAAKPIWHYPLHLRHVVTLPWKLKSQIFCKYSPDMENANKFHFIPSNVVIYPEILIFLRVWDSEFSSYWLHMKFSVSLCSFTCLLLRSVCGTGNSSQQTSLQCLSTINVAFSDEDKILIKTHKYIQHTQLRA